MMIDKHYKNERQKEEDNLDEDLDDEMNYSDDE